MNTFMMFYSILGTVAFSLLVVDELCYIFSPVRYNKVNIVFIATYILGFVGTLITFIDIMMSVVGAK